MLAFFYRSWNIRVDYNPASLLPQFFSIQIVLKVCWIFLCFLDCLVFVVVAVVLLSKFSVTVVNNASNHIQIGFETTSIFWDHVTTRKRRYYTCSIYERFRTPRFKVKVHSNGTEGIHYTSCSAKGIIWKRPVVNKSILYLFYLVEQVTIQDLIWKVQELIWNRAAVAQCINHCATI